MNLDTCPPVAQLAQLLRRELSDALVATLNEHVQGCAVCQKTMQRISATLVDVHPDETARSAGTVAFARNNPVTEKGRGPMMSDRLDFLEPAVSPDELGWLSRYRVLKVLGQGGMGMVLLAEDPELQRRVALKVIHPDLGRDEDTRQRFLREARAMAQVKSDHVITIYQVDAAHDVCFIAMELLEGEPLDAWLSQTRPSLSEALRIGREIAVALQAAHARGLMHRDVKPANVWLEAASRRVKLLDFGLARPVAADARLTSTGTIMGSPAYMAPEQARGETVDSRADLFSLGCVLYEMVTGRLPFTGETAYAILIALAVQTPAPPNKLNPTIPTAFNDLIVRLLSKTPADRPASALDVIEQLQALESPAPDRSVKPVAAGRVVPRKVLLVEPSRAQAGIIRRFLQDKVAHVVAVTSGKEALAAVQADPPQAIVTSMHLVDMSGMDLLSQIRRECAAPPGFVLVSSAAEKSEDATLGGKAVVLQKPFTPEKLLDALKAVTAPPRSAGDLRVLIVDDSTPARMHVRKVLTGLGLSRFEDAADGAQAVAVVARETFDLIVTDYNMPFMDGRGLVGFLKQNPATASVPIIMVTSEEDPAKLEAVRQLGVTAVCNKSFPPETVRKVIDQLVSAS